MSAVAGLPADQHRSVAARRRVFHPPAGRGRDEITGPGHGGDGNPKQGQPATPGKSSCEPRLLRRGRLVRL